MAKLYFKYGAMGSSKTANALMTEYNYREKHYNTLLVKPETDTRDGERIIKSRIGLQRECILIHELLEMDKSELSKYDVIIVDEAQFLSKEEVDFLSDIVDFQDITVICYGLRADFKNELFEGSKRLLAISDHIEEIKTMCWCGAKAVCNVRYGKRGVIRSGSQVELGGNDKYLSLCRKHFKLGLLSAEDVGRRKK